MTQPYVLAPAYPDAELFVLSLLDAFLPELVETVPQMAVEKIDTWLPEAFDPPFIRIQRTGGAPDGLDITDYPILTVATYGETRQTAWSLSRVVEQILLGAKYHSIEVLDVGWVLCDTVFLNAGGEQLPDLDPDDRRVVASYVFGFRRQ